MALKIAICDDDPLACKTLSDYIDKYASTSSLNIEVSCYVNGSSLLESDIEFDILFLDIMLGDEDGIEVGRKLRMQGSRGLFVISTSREDKHAAAIEITVFRYIIKPFQQEKVASVLEAAIDLLQEMERSIQIKYRHKTNYVKVNEIILIESYMRKRFVYTLNEAFQTTQTMDEIYRSIKCLPNFFRLQKAFIINFDYVTSNTKQLITLNNSREIRFLKGNYNRYQVAYSAYIRSKI